MPPLVANPFSAMRASLRRWPSDDFEDGLAHGGQCLLRRRPVDSFFPSCCFEPTILVAVLPRPERRLKDTAANIFATREFVVNLVPRSMAEAMNITNIDAPPGKNELTLADLQAAPSTSVKPPRVTTGPVAFGCRLVSALSINSDQAVIFGEVITVFVSDHLVVDAAHGIVDGPRLDLFGAMHAAR